VFLQSFFVFGQNWHNVFYLQSVNVDFVVLFFVGQNWHSVFCLWSVLPGVVFFPLQSHLDLVMRIGVLLFVDVFFCSWFCGDGKWPSTFSHHPACNNLCNRPERYKQNKNILLNCLHLSLNQENHLGNYDNHLVSIVSLAEIEELSFFILFTWL